MEKQHVKYHFVPDHKWLVVISASICQTISIGFVFSFGSLLLEILEEFGESRAAATVAQSVMIGIMLGAGIINGSLITHFGPRKSGIIGGILTFIGAASSYFASSVIFLVISLGIVTGWGCSILYLASVTATLKSFAVSGKYLALSCVSCLSGVGNVCYPYLYSWLTPALGMQGTLLVVSGLFLNNIPAAGLWGSSRIEVQEADESANETSAPTKRKTYICIVRALLHNKQYILFVLGAVLTLSTFNSFLAVAFDVFKSKGLDMTRSLQIFLVFNATTTIARVTPGMLKQVPHLGSLFIVVVIILVGLSGYIGLIVAGNYTGIMLSCLLMGVGYGGIVGCVTVTTAKITTQENYTGAVSLLFTMSGVVSGSLPPLAGLVYDRTQSYDMVVYFLVAETVGGATCALIAAILRGRQQPTRKRVMSVFTVSRL